LNLTKNEPDRTNVGYFSKLKTYQIERLHSPPFTGAMTGNRIF
jgi:hypothetical protein